MIALPSSPGNVVPVREVAGRPIYQAYIGSSANPGLRDFAVPALMVHGRQDPDHISFDVNQTSRLLIENMIEMGLMESLIKTGARFHQAGCNGCIGMGQASATEKISLRTVPRNFPGRSGTVEDQVYLCSPETATASALTGVITDPRTLEIPYPRFTHPASLKINTALLVPPDANENGIELEKGPNIKPMPVFGDLPDRLEGPVCSKWTITSLPTKSCRPVRPCCLCAATPPKSAAMCSAESMTLKMVVSGGLINVIRNNH